MQKTYKVVAMPVLSNNGLTVGDPVFESAYLDFREGFHFHGLLEKTYQSQTVTPIEAKFDIWCMSSAILKRGHVLVVSLIQVQPNDIRIIQSYYCFNNCKLSAKR